MSFEELGSGPDISGFDRTKVDFGNDVEVVEPPKAEEPPPAEEPKVEPKAEEPVEEPKVEEVAEEEKHPQDPKTGKFEPKIPKSRFDEQVGKEREAREAAERRAAELERQLAERQRGEQKQAEEATRTAELEALEAKASELEQQHAQLLLDGDVKKAAEVMKEIRHTERSIAKAETAAETQQIIAQVSEGERMNVVIARLESDYPTMNPQSAEYDDALVNFALAEQARLIQTAGMRPSEALDTAARTVMERFGKKAEPEPEPKTDEGLAKAAQTVQDRKTAQVQKNLETDAKQPPSVKDVGLDSDKLGEKQVPTAANMTLEEFQALPESVKARMRGDSV